MESINNNLEIISLIVSIIILLSPLILKKYFGKSYIASLTITIGIFGTFLGVFLGLYNFNTDNITESVPVLINGLKTAFLTSLAGLGANLLLRIVPSVYGFKKETELKSDNIGEQIVESLSKLSNSIAGDGEATLVTQIQKLRATNVDGFNDSNKKFESLIEKTESVNNNLNKLSNSIAGEGEATLVTQMQKLRTSNTDGFSLMKKSFEEFAEKVVADNTQSLIDALAQVMRDFNSKINEQFGENFKKLNEAVTSMVVWQSEYKTHVETLTEKFTSISDNIKGVDASLENTALSHKKINQMNEVLNNLIKDFSTEVNSFAEIGAKAKDAFPIIESNMNNLVEASQKYISKNIDNLFGQYNSFADKQNEIVLRYGVKLNEFDKINSTNYKNFAKNQDDISNFTTAYISKNINNLNTKYVSFEEKQEEIVINYGKRLKEFDEITSNNFNKHSDNQERLVVQSTDFINKNIENITKQYDVFAENQKNIVANYTKKLDEFSDTNEINFEKYSLRQEELSNSYNKTISEMITGNADRIQKLDAELGQELNKALESLGSNLTSLSQHFVNDYKPLTESLKRVVEMSRDIEK
jgi:hypothetical protein